VQKKTEPTGGGRCSICGRPSDEQYRPFCSRRCSDIDLGRWLSGSYAIAGGAEGADEDGDDALSARGQDATEERRHEDE
jgi:endogenous inhibitor of DNA gyrase (YacG/DUF329 family)